MSRAHIVGNTTYGKGTLDVLGASSKFGPDIISYAAWHGIMQRCYDAKWHTRYPTYRGCTVDTEWLLFSKFRAWFRLQKYKPGYQLDKDILIPGNKVYGPDACAFVPQYINKILCTRTAARTQDLPRGVYLESRCTKYLSALHKYGKLTKLGRYDTIIEAELVYLYNKTLYIHEAVPEAFKRGDISKAVHDAILTRFPKWKHVKSQRKEHKC